MSNSSCTTPVTLPPVSVSPSILEQLRTDDDSFDFDGLTSPTSKRCPTFKEYQDKIKQLQKENFQLRVRIYLNERETGVKTSSSDIAVLYSQFPQLQNGTGNQVPTHSTAHVQSSPSSTSAASAFDSLTNELEKVKTEKEELQMKLNEQEVRFTAKVTELERRNEEVRQKNEELTQELVQATSTIQKFSENQSSASNEEAIEKLACFAFGQNEDVELLNAELEQKLSEKNSEIARLEGELEIVRKKLISAEKKIDGYKAEARHHEALKSEKDIKYQEMSEALQGMGKKVLHLQNRNHKLEKQIEQLRATKDLDKIAFSPNSDKYESIQQLVSLLLERMKEVTDFVKTLLQLEAQKVVTLPLLTDENRASLLKSVEQCRLFSKNLEDILYKKDQIAESHTSSSFFGRESHYSNSSRNYHYSLSTSPAANQSRSLFSALDRVRLKSDGVQCNIVDSSLKSSLDSANAYINQLKHDMSTLQRINHQLGQEKTELISQVKTLESNVLRISNHAESSENLQLANSKLKEENRKLKNRISVVEDALRELHGQHATLVGELKKLKSVNHKGIPPSTSVGSTIADSNRPSDSTSPDLGIDSGHDGAMNSDDSNGNNYKEENRILRTTNRELALKLKQTRQALDNTIEKLNSTTKEKEQVEKAICRQLHKTHTILRQAKRSVEKFTNSQCQENIMPQSSS